MPPLEMQDELADQEYALDGMLRLRIAVEITRALLDNPRLKWINPRRGETEGHWVRSFPRNLDGTITETERVHDEKILFVLLETLAGGVLRCADHSAAVAAEIKDDPMINPIAITDGRKLYPKATLEGVGKEMGGLFGYGPDGVTREAVRQMQHEGIKRISQCQSLKDILGFGVLSDD